MTIEHLIAEAVRNGLRGFTLYQTQDGQWQASTTADRLSWSVTLAADPVSAITQVLGAPTVEPAEFDIFN